MEKKALQQVVVSCQISSFIVQFSLRGAKQQAVLRCINNTLKRLNGVCNEILDRDCVSAPLFVTQSARDHVGVPDLNFGYLLLDTHVIRTSITRALMAFFANVRNVSCSFQVKTCEKRYRRSRSKEVSKVNYAFPFDEPYDAFEVHIF